MKRILLFFASVIITCSVLAVKNINIVFIGNSITYGATLGSPATEAPPVRVKEILSEKLANPVYISNCGHSGSTTLDWLPGTSFFNEALAAATNLQKKGGVLYFSLMLGTNDSASSGCNGSPVNISTYLGNVKRIIDTLRESFPEARFIVNYPIWYSPNTHNGATYLQAGLNRLKTYHSVITTMCNSYASKDIAVYPGNKETFTFFENNNSMFTPEAGYDGTFYLHPNATGAIKLAEFWANSILEHAEDIIDTVSTKYIKQINEAEKLYERCFVYQPLVSEASQLSSNSVTMAGQLASLIDGNLQQNLQTWPSYGPDKYCYIQSKVNISGETEAYVGFTVPSGSYPGDYPADVKVEYSADGASWTTLTQFNLVAENLNAGTWVNSEQFAINSKMKYLRFTSLNNSYPRAGEHHFAIGEFNVFAKDREASLYYKSDEARIAIDALKEAIGTFKAKLEEDAIEESDVTALQQAMDAVADNFGAVDKLNTLLDEAKDINSLIYTKTDGLITQLKQITTNASGNDNPYIAHNLENLYDNNIYTVYQTWPSFPANDYSYLQFDLTETPISGFYVRFSPYQNQACGVPDLPYIVKFYFSEDKGKTWAETLNYTFVLKQGFGLSDFYDSPVIMASKPYGTIRMQMIQHQADRGSGHPKLFGMSEFQIYGLKEDAPCHSQKVMAEYDKLQQSVTDAQTKVDNNNVTTEDVEQLKQSIASVKQAIEEYYDELSAVTALPTATTPASTSIYTISGQRIATPQKGLNIINGHVVKVD